MKASLYNIFRPDHGASKLLTPFSFVYQLSLCPKTHETVSRIYISASTPLFHVRNLKFLFIHSLEFLFCPYLIYPFCFFVSFTYLSLLTHSLFISFLFFIFVLESNKKYLISQILENSP